MCFLTSIGNHIVRLMTLIGTFFWASVALAQLPTPVPVVPVIFNAPSSARAGDVVGLQGEHFGEDPLVLLAGPRGEPSTRLPIVNKFGTGWVSARIPENAKGALTVQVGNGQELSAPVKLNAARPLHLDATQIVPGGAFRIFGRNLLLPGSAPLVFVNGAAAPVDMAASDEHTLVLTAPLGLLPQSKAAISVDNGNGSGPSTLDRSVSVTPAIVASANRDPFSLGVGWASAFSEIAARVVNVVTDQTLKPKISCDGVTDNSPAIQSAVNQLAATGGGVLQLPTGTCRLTGSVTLKSKVVLQGAGKDQTVLRYEGNYPIWGRGLTLTGLRHMTLSSAGGRIESPLLQQSNRVFFQSVRFALNGGIHMFLTDNSDFVVIDSEFVQPKNPNDFGPYHFAGTRGLVFVNNTTTFANGSPTFARVHDAYIASSRFTRDARNNQDSKGVIHSLAIDFAHHLAIVGNTFDVLGGPIANKVRNDGETILTEGGGGNRTENLGTVESATEKTLFDSRNTINVAPFVPGTIPENYGVAIVGGKGAGQTRRVVGYADHTLSVDRAWDLVPDTTSRYATFVWGLEKSLIKNNRLSQNPRGIWFYKTAIRDVEIVGNTITEGGGIYLRADQNLKDKQFTPIYGVRIAHNTVSNTSREWASNIHIAFVRVDSADFGLATIGVDLNNNTVNANQPNLSLAQEESGSAEGFLSLARFEGQSQGLARNQIRLLGTLFQKNTCVGCDIPFRVREGAYGTVQDRNLALPPSR